MYMDTIWLVLWLVEYCQPNVISTAQGKLRGSARAGYVSYNGIPYATVSGHHGSFKKAGLAPYWSGMRESQPCRCSSTSSVEECLQLDVHVPSGGATWPVLVWVTGNDAIYNPTKLVQQGIIVVTVHHRLGPLGFLCLGNDTAPGNAGVNDVVVALRWVRDNIVAFKGNPAKVVVAGQSLGAAMVEALMMSQMANGLYHGAILQSGSVLSPWAFNYDAKERAMMLSQYNLLDVQVEELVRTSDTLNVPYFPFGICVEDPLKKEERLISDAPYNVMVSGKVAKVPMIIGYNSDEAYVFASVLKEANVLRKMLKNINFILPEELKFLNEREMNLVTRQVIDMYFKNNFTMDALFLYHRDAYFVNHVHRSARFHAAAKPVFYYEFSYTGGRGVQPEPGVQKQGAAHSDELAYLFTEDGDGDGHGDDSVVQRRLVKLWTNFVKYLNPTPHREESIHWEAMDPDNPRLLNIGSEVAMAGFGNARAIQMWDEIFDKYYYSRCRTT